LTRGPRPMLYYFRGSRSAHRHANQGRRRFSI